MTCIIGCGVDTPEALVYGSGGFDMQGAFGCVNSGWIVKFFVVVGGLVTVNFSSVSRRPFHRK